MYEILKEKYGDLYDEFMNATPPNHPDYTFEQFARDSGMSAESIERGLEWGRHLEQTRGPDWRKPQP